MTQTDAQVYEQLLDHFREIAKLRSTLALLEWDERTMIPAQGGEYRAEQVALLSGLIHRRVTDPQVGQQLEQLSESSFADDPHSPTGATVRELRRNYEKRSKLPQRLVEELSRATSLGQQIWTEARQADDFTAFQPQLETIVRLTREKAEAFGYEDSIYDPLLDDFEPGERTAAVARVLGALREELAPLVAQIVDSGVRAPVEIVQRQFDIPTQNRLGTEAAELIGFDFQRGRLDTTAHPFCTTLGPSDCRILTRYEADFFNSAFFGTLHEAGHGIYEQGLPAEHFGLPLGDYCSLGIHESQSRLWENLVGRSRAFWQFFYPRTKAAFPSLADVDVEAFHAAVNHVEPSLIRVEADEATYNLHIIIRFELEQALMNGELTVADLPDAWDAKYESVLGVKSSNRADGVLQDVHWSAGLFGYFATYSLGNLYAAQLFEAAGEALGDLDEQFAAGDFATLRGWLQEKIYDEGSRLPAPDLVQQATGKSLGHEALMRSLRAKYGPLYQLD